MTLVESLSARAAQIQSLSARVQVLIDDVERQVAMIDRRLKAAGFDASHVEMDVPAAAHERPSRRRTTQPRKGSLALPDLVIAVLGNDTLSGGEIYTAVRECSASDVPPNRIYPTLWRMVKMGRLDKKNEKYQASAPTRHPPATVDGYAL